MATIFTAGAANVTPGAWQTRIESHAASAKLAIETNDFTFFHILRANDHINDVDTTALFFQVAGGPDADAVKTELDNINIAVVGSMQNEFEKFKIDTERLKKDKNPNEEAWITVILDNDKKLKGDFSAAVDASSRAAIARIKREPEGSRPAAANVFIKGRTIVMGFVQTLLAALSSVISHITEFFKGIWNAMSNAWNSVKNGANSAWKAIKGVFSFGALAAMPSAPSAPFKLCWPAAATTAAASLGIKTVLDRLAMHGFVASSESVSLVAGNGTTDPVISAEISVRSLLADSGEAIGEAFKQVVATLPDDGHFILGYEGGRS